MISPVKVAGGAENNVGGALGVGVLLGIGVQVAGRGTSVAVGGNVTDGKVVT
jgi:hypothetical protein